MSEVLVVSKTHMHNGVCVGGVVLETERSVRLIPAGALCQPSNTPLNVGQVWEIGLHMRGTPAPFVEDADADCKRMLRAMDVAHYVRASLPIAHGDTNAVYDGLLQWNPGGKGFLEPANPTPYSTQFWQPASTLRRYDEGDHSILWEPGTKHRIRWVGVAAPPETVPAGSLVRLSVGRPFHGDQDHDVCWLQVSGVY